MIALPFCILPRPSSPRLPFTQLSEPLQRPDSSVGLNLRYRAGTALLRPTVINSEVFTQSDHCCLYARDINGHKTPKGSMIVMRHLFGWISEGGIISSHLQRVRKSRAEPGPFENHGPAPRTLVLRQLHSGKTNIAACTSFVN